MEVAVRQQSLCLLLEEGESRKSRGLRIYEWMGKLGKCVCCVYQKRRNVTKVGRPTEKPNFVVLEEGESPSTRVCSLCGTKVSN